MCTDSPSAARLVLADHTGRLLIGYEEAPSESAEEADQKAE